MTQTALGAGATQATMSKKLGRVSCLIGGLGGAIPDFDFLLEPLSDPALPWEYHRHFTHSILFIPIAGLLAALPFLILPGRFGRELRGNARFVFLAGVIGAATHGLLDMCTSFGTSWYLPFSATRDAWDLLSIIDPLFSLPLYLAVILCLILNRMRVARVGIAWCVLYTSFAFIQHGRAERAMNELASSRGHTVERSRVMPTFGNTILWRSVYVHDGRAHADALHVAPFGDIRVQQGSGALPIVTDETLDPGVRDPERVREVFHKFERFTDGYIGVIPNRPGMLGDLRYSFDPAAHEPIWGVEIVEFTPYAAASIDSIIWTRGTQQDPDRARRSLESLFDRMTNPGPEFVLLDEIRSKNRAEP